MPDLSSVLLQSLIAAPLLLSDLPEAPAFPTETLTFPPATHPLNLQQKLGHLYEDALAQLLHATPRYAVLAQNLQIQKDQHHTLGELDFLLRDLDTGRLIHLELATKFYLAIHSPTGLSLPGPDARDHYFKKLARLREHQLLLPHLFKHDLPPEFRDQDITSKHLVNGCLFDHIKAAHPADPPFLSPAARRGTWLYQHEIAQHFPAESHFHLIPKALWPAPLHLISGLALAPWSPQQELTRCVMLRINHASTPHFIAPSSYPSFT